MNDNNIASKFKATICILFGFSQIIVLVILMWPHSKDPLFGTVLYNILLIFGQIIVYLFVFGRTVKTRYSVQPQLFYTDFVPQY